MRIFALAALAVFAAACTPPAPAVRAPAEGETSVTGLVGQVEDGGYPQFTVTVQPERGEPLALYLNAESGADLGSQTPGAFAGQQALIYYTSTDELNVTDIRTSAGASLVHADGRAAPTEGGSITGALSGAEAVTASDLPGAITVTDAAGRAETFNYYIDDRLVAANGQQVTVHYAPGVRNEITLMQSAGGD